MKSISNIKSYEIKHLKVSFIILLLFIILFLITYYIKKINFLHFYCPFFILAVFVFLICRVFILLRINKIEKNPILKNELDSIILNVSGIYFLTDNYIVRYFSNSLIKYDDIVLSYYKTYSNLSRGISKMMYVVEKNGKVSSFEVSNTAVYLGDEPKDFKNILLEKNPKILIGLSQENKEKLFDTYKIKL